METCTEKEGRSEEKGKWNQVWGKAETINRRQEQSCVMARVCLCACMCVCVFVSLTVNQINPSSQTRQMAVDEIIKGQLWFVFRRLFIKTQLWVWNLLNSANLLWLFETKDSATCSWHRMFYGFREWTWICWGNNSSIQVADQGEKKIRKRGEGQEEERQ